MCDIGFVVLILTITQLVSSDTCDETTNDCFCSDNCSVKVCIQVTNDGCVVIGDDVNVTCSTSPCNHEPLFIKENSMSLDSGNMSDVIYSDDCRAALNFQASPENESTIFGCEVHENHLCPVEGDLPMSPDITMHFLGDLHFKGPCNASQSIMGTLNVSCELVNVSENCTDKLMLVINTTPEETLIGPRNYTWDDDDVLHFSITTCNACDAMIIIRVSNTALNTTRIDCDGVPLCSITPTSTSMEPSESTEDSVSTASTTPPNGATGSTISGSVVFVMVGIIVHFIIAELLEPHRHGGGTHLCVQLSNTECSKEQNGLHSQQESFSLMSKTSSKEQGEGTCSIPRQPIPPTDSAEDTCSIPAPLTDDTGVVGHMDH